MHEERYNFHREVRIVNSREERSGLVLQVRVSVYDKGVWEWRKIYEKGVMRVGMV